MPSIATVQQTQAPLPAVLMSGGHAVRTASGENVKTAFAQELAAAQQNSAPVSLLPEATQEAPAAPKIARSYRMADADKATKVNDGESLSFGDFIDLINPLHHIPIVGSIYRALSGDEIKPEVKVAGSFLLGAATGGVLLGAAAGIASAAFEETNGKEPVIELADNIWGGDHAGPDNIEDKKIQLAAATEEPMPAPAAAPAVQVLRKKEAILTPVQMANVAPPAENKVELPAKTQVMLAAPGAQRVGNVLYTSPAMRAAAKAIPAQKPAESAAPAATATAQMDSQTLGSMIHEQAKTREAGNPLPPELVQDMMIMALDKYKAAQATPAAPIP